MSKFYPTERQRGLYNLMEYKEERFQVATNASAKYFRESFKIIHVLYLILFAVSALEWLGYFFGSMLLGFGSGQFPSITNTGITMATAISFSLSHYYIYLVYGHGYKSAEAQFYVDKYSTLEECQGDIRLMRNFYKFSLFTSVATLVLSWITAKIPLKDQWVGFKEFLEVSFINAGMSSVGIPAIEEYSGTLIAFNWVVSAFCFVIFIISILGIVQTHLAKVIK